MTALTVLEAEDVPLSEAPKGPEKFDPHVAEEIAGRIKEAAEIGDVTALSQAGIELAARTDGLREYGEKISRLAEAFDFEGLLEMADTLTAAGS